MHYPPHVGRCVVSRHDQVRRAAVVGKFYLHETLSLLDSTLSDDEMFNFNPALPGFKEELKSMADQWSAINLAKHGDVVGMESRCGRPIQAGDGLVVSCRSPSIEELNGQDPTTFWNRKGCFAVIVSAFCDAWWRFRVLDVTWPGSTPDTLRITRLHCARGS